MISFIIDLAGFLIKTYKLEAIKPIKPKIKTIRILFGEDLLTGMLASFIIEKTGVSSLT